MEESDGCTMCGAPVEQCTISATLIKCNRCGAEWGRCNGVWVLAEQGRTLADTDPPKEA